MICMKLHNLCIDCNVEMPSHRFFADVREGVQWAVTMLENMMSSYVVEPQVIVDEI
jgi:hypothetical protein